MTSAVISVASKLSSMLIKEVKFLSSIKSQVKNVIYELNAMHDFFRRADAFDRSNMDTEQWVNEVRDLAFEVEDVIEEFSMLNSVTVTNVGARHDVGMKLENLRDRFKKARDRFETYRIPSAGSLPANREWDDSQEDAMFLKEEDLVGIEVAREKLIKLLVQGDNNAHKVSVVGMGGIGKTTLVNQVYKTAAVKSTFDSHAFIHVSKNLTVEDLLKDLIKQICEESCLPWVSQEYDTMTSLALKEKVNELLSGKTYVIILDDLQSVDQWKGSRNAFPDNECRCRVVVTTRSEDVATTNWKGRDVIYKLEPLTSEDSLKLFRKNAFREEDRRRPTINPDFLEVSEKILKKCMGLPLAIVAISGVLIAMDTPEEWVSVYNRLGGELHKNAELKSICKILRHSYYYLPEHLKPCFLYMSLFPEYQPIGRLRLLRLWLAEGFVERKDQNMHMTLEEVAESYLDQLIRRHMVRVAAKTSDGRDKAYSIHSLVREIILGKSREEQFASVTDCAPLSKVARRLSVHNNMLVIMENGDENSYQSLRSFLMFDVDKPLNKTSIPVLCRGFRLLAVLDLQGADLDHFPTSIIELSYLRYLSLKYTTVSKIPKDIHKLQRLETLDLKCTLVVKLPEEILKLKRLSNLLVYRNDRDTGTAFHSKHGFKAPKKGMGCLTELQKLCFIEAGEKSGNLVQELQALTKLQRLGILKLSQKNGKALCSSISKLRELRALSVTSSEDHKLALDDLSDPPPCLERIYLTGQMASLPTWIGELQNLVKIYLKSSKLHENPLMTLELLPNLVHIELHQAYKGSEMCFKGGKLGKLKILGLHKFASLAQVTIEEHAMRNLENFLIQDCPLLTTLPQGIGYLETLKVLDFVEMPQVLISTLQPPPKEGRNYTSIKHIPQVRFSSRVNMVWTTSNLSTQISSRGMDLGAHITEFEDK
ncbi:unnamed protein product [Rhodiola kirilowii]